MGQKKKKKAPQEDIKMEFANTERTEAFSIGLDSEFPECKYSLNGATVKIWAPKAQLAAICTMSENPVYARRKLVRLTQF